MKKQGLMAAVLIMLTAFLFSGCAGLFAPKPTKSVTFWNEALQNVVMVTSDGLSKNWAKISPDGEKLIYCEGNKEGDWDIVLLRNASVAAKTQLVKDAFRPAWYENSSTYLYVKWEDSTNKILRSSVTGGGKTYLTRTSNGKGGESRPAVHKGVVICNSPDGDLISMKDNGTEYTMLGQGYSPSWHPFENKFLFIRDGNVYEMNTDTTQITGLYEDPKYNCEYPSYSGDGQYILFQKGTEVKVTGTRVTLEEGKEKKKMSVVSKVIRWQIFYMRADGGGVSPLTEGTVSAFSPSWDKNNNVYFISSASGKTEIYKARINILE